MQTKDIDAIFVDHSQQIYVGNASEFSIYNPMSGLWQADFFPKVSGLPAPKFLMEIQSEENRLRYFFEQYYLDYELAGDGFGSITLFTYPNISYFHQRTGNGVIVKYLHLKEEASSRQSPDGACLTAFNRYKQRRDS